MVSFISFFNSNLKKQTSLQAKREFQIALTQKILLKYTLLLKGISRKFFEKVFFYRLSKNDRMNDMRLLERKMQIDDQI